MPAVLGISAFYHDSAAALVVDGEIVAAAQEERFSREKHDSSFPARAARWCLSEAGLRPESLDYVGFYDKPFLKFDRLLESHLATAPHGYAAFRTAMPPWLRQKLHLPREMRAHLPGFEKRFVFVEHHESHAASAFFPSPFEEAAILTLDGVGEWATGSFGTGRGDRIELTHELRFPHSLGLLYSAFTYFLGFSPNGDEYKIMGLAPYGEPIYADRIRETLLDLKEDGSFRMDQSFFAYCHGLRMTGPRFDELFDGPPRSLRAPLTQREMDLAASVQTVTEEVLLRCARHVHARTGMRNLCLAGGVALNCVGNGRLLREGPFGRLWIQPAADDAGGALGVALFIEHQLCRKPRRVSSQDAERGALLGPSWSQAEIEAFLAREGAPHETAADDADLCERVAAHLAEGRVVGWFQGRMEFGPRALGSRSILADPRLPTMQSLINQKVKFREGFRPFAPAVLAEHAEDWFDVGAESPYMLLVGPVAEHRLRTLSPEEQKSEGFDRLRVARSEIPAVTHVDGSARVQTVDAERSPLLRQLLEAFHRRTGCPVLVNTSFNLGWDPIVCTPKDAWDTFMSCGIDVLALGRSVVEKRRQPSWVTPLEGAEREASFDDLLACPCCGGVLRRSGSALACESCDRDFEDEDGIARLFWPHDDFGDDEDVTERVKKFYEETPFPNYDEHDSLRSLIDSSRRGIYARKLSEAIPYNSTVLEVGCGTGQLANFLGIASRRVLGTDLCLNSLHLGEQFRRQQGLARVRFLQMNLFRPALRRGAFDVVVCNGVLHHTADPLGGFRELVPLVKPGGHFVVGLYNRFGRLMTDLRRVVFRATGGRGRWLDPRLRREAMNDRRLRAWFADQYQHPHESKHTLGEVLRWFDESGLEFVRAIPSAVPGVDALGGDASLFEPVSCGSALERGIAQLGQVVSGNREGGLFVMIGRRPADAAGPGGAGCR